jgi:hypothetical protein
MLNQTRRDFLKIAGITGFSISNVMAETNKNKQDAKILKGNPTSKIRIAQVKVYPDKGKMKANHTSMMNVLKDIENGHNVDVVVTPEGFLDGYISTEI